MGGRDMEFLGDGYGSGYGSGYGDGYGYGYGSGSGSGYGSGYGYGYGYGSGYGDGFGYGYGKQEVVLAKEDAWVAWHYIKKTNNGYKLRNGQVVKMGEVVEEPEIKMCERGLHASLNAEDAIQYAPAFSVLTKVKVWGRIEVQKDKLVATHRMIEGE